MLLYLRYIRITLNKRISKVQKAWRAKKIEREFAKMCREQKEKEERQMKGAQKLDKAMFKINNIKAYVNIHQARLRILIYV